MKHSLILTITIILFSIVGSAANALPDISPTSPDHQMTGPKTGPENKKTYRPKYEDSDIMFRIVARTPENISAFYQGREFSKKAINEILNTCYITVIIKNKTRTTLWLELDNWQFSRNGKPITRIKRDYWKKRWDSVNLNQAHRSTFGWTLMPESRDLRTDEGVGGSIVIPKQTSPFTITANFHTRPNKSGPLKTVTINGAKCIEDIQPAQ